MNCGFKVLGYGIKQGSDISVRPSGKERYLRLARILGQDYTIDSIRKQILSHRDVRLPIRSNNPTGSPPPMIMQPILKGSIWALHRHYLYLFGFYEQQNHGGKGSNARMHYLLRDDLRNLNEIIADEKLLDEKSIESDTQLHSYKGTLIHRIAELNDERAELKQSIRANANGESYTTKDNPKYQQLNKQIRKLQKEVRQCERIGKRSENLKERIERIEHDETAQPRREENKEYGRIRAGSRAGSENHASRH